MPNLRILLLTLCSAIMLSCSSDADENPVDNTGSPSHPQADINAIYTYDTDETAMAGLINDYRRQNDFNALILQDYISFACEGHNDYMIENKVVNHDFFQQRAEDLEQNLGATIVSENVAFNYQASQGAFDAWLQSSGHKANIDGSFTHFGVSVSADDTGKKYYTVLFASIPIE